MSIYKKCYLPSFLLTTFVAFIALFSASTATAKTIKIGSNSHKVIGTVNASIDGKKYQMYTLEGKGFGDDGSSAVWGTIEAAMDKMSDQMPDIMDSLTEQLTPEQQEQIKKLFGNSENGNPLLDAMKAFGGAAIMDNVNVEIYALSEKTKKIMGDDSLSISVTFNADEDPSSKVGESISADITYVKTGSEGMMPEVFYVSDEDHKMTTVKFKELTFGETSGNAKGSFEGELCRMERATMMQGPNFNDCIEVSGTFDTKLKPQK